MSHTPLLERLLQGSDLATGEARSLMLALFDDATGDATKGAALAILRMRGVRGPELAAFATVLRERVVTVPVDVDGLVDTCGTGGGIPSFNLSTAAALVACAGGAKVAKHGNRAVTSKCGSADVLEAFGVPIGLAPDQLRQLVQSVGIAFLFAPGHHPTMKSVGSVRSELGFRTVFNQLGPLANPFGARRQLLGVYDRSLVRPMAEALSLLGAEQAVVVHGADGLDEVSPCGDTIACWVEGANVLEAVLRPSDFGLETLGSDSIAAGDSVQSNAAILREALTDADSPRAKAILPNAAVTLYLAGLVDSLPEGACRASEIIASGAALAKLLELVEKAKQV